MTIERLHFEQPWVLDRSRSIREQLASAVAANGHRITPLLPGEYNLTPRIWTKHTHEHNLTVHRDGTGTYTMSPRDNTVGTMVFEGGRTSEFQPGELVVQVSEAQPVVPLVGGIPRTENLGIFEVILFTPDAQSQTRYV